MKKSLVSMVVLVLTALPLLGAPAPGLSVSVAAATKAAASWEVYESCEDATEGMRVCVELKSQGYLVTGGARTDGGEGIVIYIGR